MAIRALARRQALEGGPQIVHVRGRGGLLYPRFPDVHLLPRDEGLGKCGGCEKRKTFVGSEQLADVFTKNVNGPLLDKFSALVSGSAVLYKQPSAVT